MIFLKIAEDLIIILKFDLEIIILLNYPANTHFCLIEEIEDRKVT